MALLGWDVISHKLLQLSSTCDADPRSIYERWRQRCRTHTNTHIQENNPEWKMLSGWLLTKSISEIIHCYFGTRSCENNTTTDLACMHTVNNSLFLGWCPYIDCNGVILVTFSNVTLFSGCEVAHSLWSEVYDSDTEWLTLFFCAQITSLSQNNIFSSHLLFWLICFNFLLLLILTFSLCLPVSRLLYDISALSMQLLIFAHHVSPLRSLPFIKYDPWE